MFYPMQLTYQYGYHNWYFYDKKQRAILVSSPAESILYGCACHDPWYYYQAGKTCGDEIKFE